MKLKVQIVILLLYQGGGMKINYKRFGEPVYPSSSSTSHIVLLPENFRVSETAQPVSRRDFLSVLAKVTSVMVRASYSTERSAVYRWVRLIIRCKINHYIKIKLVKSEVFSLI